MASRKHYGDFMPQSNAGFVGAVATKRTHDPAAWAAALEAVDGDARRLQVEPDGSITTLNKPRASKHAGTSPFR